MFTAALNYIPGITHVILHRIRKFTQILATRSDPNHRLEGKGIRHHQDDIVILLYVVNPAGGKQKKAFMGSLFRKGKKIGRGKSSDSMSTHSSEKCYIEKPNAQIRSELTSRRSVSKK